MADVRNGRRSSRQSCLGEWAASRGFSRSGFLSLGFLRMVKRVTGPEIGASNASASVGALGCLVVQSRRVKRGGNGNVAAFLMSGWPGDTLTHPVTDSIPMIHASRRVVRSARLLWSRPDKRSAVAVAKPGARHFGIASAGILSDE